jgi:GT2 family glycosyltransferase
MSKSLLKVIRKNLKAPTFRTLTRMIRNQTGLRKLAVAEDRVGLELAAARLQAAARFRSRLVSFLSSTERLSFPRTETPEISIVILLFNQSHLTLACLEALLREAVCGNSPAFEIVLVDNASSDETADLLRRVDGVHVIRNQRNIGFPRGCNQGAKEARGRLLLLLNNDAVVRPGSIEAARDTLDGDRTIGAVGGRLIFPGGRLQEAGSILWSDGSTLGYGRGWEPDRGEAMFRRDVDYCSGALLMTPLALWRQLGGLDEGFSPAYLEDLDYCFRLWERDMRVVYEPDAVADHFERGSEASEGASHTLSVRNRKWFRARHAQSLRRYQYQYAPASATIARVPRRSARRTLLLIDNEVPLPSLGQGFPRARQLLVAALEQGWSICVFGLHQERVDWARARQDIPKEVELIAGGTHAGLRSFIEERQHCFDVIVVSRPDNYRHFCEAIQPLPQLRQNFRIVYDAEALFARRDILRTALGGAPLPPDEAAAMIDREIDLTAGADAIVCVSENEAAEFRRRTSTPVHRLSHAITVRHDTPGFGDRGGFLFIGRLLERQAPNFQGLSWFIREVWPLVRAQTPSAILTVAGHLCAEHAELVADGVRLVGPIDDLAHLYDSSCVFIAPIRFAAGIPIKILEASAAGLPTVATRLMADQLGWDNGSQIIAVDDRVAMAQACVTLAGEPRMWAEIRAAAQHSVQLDHGLDQFRQQVSQILEQPPAAAADD